MARWFSKRWVWAALAGATVTVGIAAGGGGEPPKVGDVITLNFQGVGERKLRVLKSEQQPDGSYLTEVKDLKTGETLTLLDNPEDPKPNPPAPPMKLDRPKDTLKGKKEAIKDTVKETFKAKPRPADPRPAEPVVSRPAPTPEPPKDTAKSKRPSDPLLPAVASAPDSPKEEKKRPLLNKLFGDKEPSPAPAAAPLGTTTNAGPRMEMPADPPRRMGLIGRVFGSKKPAEPSLPATGTPVPSAPAAKPPAVIPLPPTGLGGSAATPQLFPPGTLPSTNEPPRAGSQKPPRPVPAPSTTIPTPMPVKPLVPTPSLPTPAPVTPPPSASRPTPAPTPATIATPAPTPAPLPIPAPSVSTPKPAPEPIPAPIASTPTPTPITPAPAATAPIPLPSAPVSTPAPLPIPLPAVPPAAALPTPAPTPAPTVPTPTPAPAVSTPTPAPLPVPTIPAVPSGGVPTIPIPPGGTSSTKPIQVIVPAGYVPPSVAFDRDVQPYVTALQTMSAPSTRLIAAKGLAEGRHCSTDGVKSVLFQAAKMDPCGEVRAACIEYLCKLGYFQPQFLGYIQAACEDTDQQVRDAAKAACEKMIRK